MNFLKWTLVIMSFLILGACAVDPLEIEVQNPSHRAALAAGAGVAPSGPGVREGRLVKVHATDGGYVGSGAAFDMNNFRPMTWSTCNSNSCVPISGAEEELTECQRVFEGRTSCADRAGGDTLLGRVEFYDDQRFSIEAADDGRFISGVWYQTPDQKQRAEQVYSAMMNRFEPALKTVYEDVANDRRAPLDFLEALGGAGNSMAGTGSSVPQDSGGGSVSDMGVRSVSVQEGYNIGDHPYEVQSRQVAKRYVCETAQAIPHVSGASCESFRALVIIEACRSIIPPSAYNQDQPEFLRVVIDFANQGEDFTAGVCGF